MTTVHPDTVFRQAATGTRPSNVNTPAIVLHPDGVIDVTLHCIASAATTGLVEQTYSSVAAIQGGSAVWLAVDATLNTVGTTSVTFVMGQRTPVAFRVTSLTTDQTATLTVTGKRMR